MMQVINVDKNNKNQPIMIFRNERENGKPYFSTTVGHKNIDGETYTNTFMPVQFKKNVEVNDKQLIVIKDAWLDFFKTKDNRDVVYLFINDFDKVESR